MATVVNGFIEYCGIPPNQILFLPCDKEPDENSRYTMPGAMHLDEDTYWHLGLQITLYEKPNIFPHQPIFFKICVKDKDGDLFVKLDQEKEPQKINLSSRDDLNVFFDKLVSLIIRYFKEGLQEFLEKETIIKKLGFI